MVWYEGQYYTNPLSLGLVPVLARLSRLKVSEAHSKIMK